MYDDSCILTNGSDVPHHYNIAFDDSSLFFPLQKTMFSTVLILVSMLNLRSFVSCSRVGMKMLDKRACFGAGCYWGTEKFFVKDFGQKLMPGSIIRGNVGFMGPTTAQKNPTYKEVCSGKTGQIEVYDMVFDGKEETYECLVKHFYSFHDPTTLNRQGNDRGSQYASAIFTYDEEQEKIAKRVTEELQVAVKAGKVKNFQEKTITTAIAPATVFYTAHDEHQRYLETNPTGYCNHGYRFNAGTWPQ